MGYKLAGCDVVAANDIDPEMEWHYRKNLAPKTFYRCPIGDLIGEALPKELHDLDILDGSPPCSAAWALTHWIAAWRSTAPPG